MSGPHPSAAALLDASLVTEVDGRWQLKGSRCERCDTVTFPAQGSCPNCTGTDVAEQPLATSGTVWASTVQRFTPKTPYLGAGGPAAEYAVGYVDVGPVLVESRLVGPVDEFPIGAGVALTFEALPAPDGGEVYNYAFRRADTHETGDRA